MTPQQKALELVDKFTQTYGNAFFAKECALIAVDEILKTLPQSEYLEDRLEVVENRELIYWKQVKQEIEKL